MRLSFGAISAATFFTEYWRRKPLYVPGGAQDLLGFRWAQAQFRAAADRLEQGAGGLVFRSAERLTFVQKLDLASPELEQVCTRWRELLAGVRIWFDGVEAEAGYSIGSHYDIADTFILQQQGTKIWALHGPGFIHERDRRSRMLNETEVDAMYMPDGAEEIRLAAGDLLYIPGFWVHWGISVDRSVSLSLCFTAEHALSRLAEVLAEGLCRGPAGPLRLGATADLLDALAAPGMRDAVHAALWRAFYDGSRESAADDGGEADPHRRALITAAVSRDASAMRAALARNPAWWRPLPLLWRDRGHPAPASVRAVDRHLHKLAATLDGAAFRRRVLAAAEAPAAARRPETSAYSRMAPVDAGEVPPSLAAVRLALAPAPAADLDPASMLPPGWPAADLRVLRRHAARRSLAAFLDVLEQGCRWARDDAVRDSTRTALTAWLRLPPETMEAAMEHGPLQGWTWRATVAMHSAYLPRWEAILSWLPQLLLPALIEGGALVHGERMLTVSSTAHSVDLLPWNLRLQCSRPVGRRIEIRCRGDSVQLAGRQGVLARLPRRWSPSAEPVPPQLLGLLQPLPRLDCDGPVLGEALGWLGAFFPGRTPEHAIMLAPAVDLERRDAWRRSMAAGWRLLHATAPRIARSLDGAVLLPRLDRPERPGRDSTRPFRRVIATVQQAPADLARTLAREAGRAVGHDLLDTETLVEGGNLDRIRSPLGGPPVSVNAIVADLLASLADAWLCGCRRPGGAGQDGTARSGQRQSLRDARTLLDFLQRQHGLTQAGAALLAAARDGLGALQREEALVR